ncbi:hypothetical protein MCOR28_003501 [Pyricularia oryzae]|nr:hypothetical protein MCOR01_002123 [Pyricularia oryzae]KAI6288187.1 hypothetical protein MCOR26_000195 [Pyricularia oryzae]KAI6322982.1 hypothetical protein MCOR34_002063 [Pyricularia oryzae]KAI6345581.1 hypothetical protein MCOR28_003501 [Pyricularia oryzae]KAI6379716.1 hypothetical protein MCOR32_004421 [Pyricularia oryzae]
MLPPPRRGSDSMEIVCKLRHTRGVMPSWGFRHPLRKREGDKKTTTHLKSYGYNLPVGTANLGVGDLGCAPEGLVFPFGLQAGVAGHPLKHGQGTTAFPPAMLVTPGDGRNSRDAEPKGDDMSRRES